MFVHFPRLLKGLRAELLLESACLALGILISASMSMVDSGCLDLTLRGEGGGNI